MANLESILSEALKRESAEDRARYLTDACGVNDHLRAEVERLLSTPAHAEQSRNSFAFSELTTSELPQAPPCVGTMVGRYKLLEEIGTGGMGTVFLAEQTEPIRRQVALKMIKLGMGSSQIIARFNAERQALALMNHPNIARVHDAGTTETGQPFFAMELIRGSPITEYCDAEMISITGRLGLFIEVCRAVQHAHQKGIIHRDLKPSNILVTLQDGVPATKVIDFGIAKAIGEPLTDATYLTGLKQFVGTMMYTSPEQAALSGDDIDTRSDVYSLGVLLYELLTGTTPFDKATIHMSPFVEAQRIIRDVEPPKPSIRLSSMGEILSTISANRRLDPRNLKSLLRGELDWIVMRTLEKERARRYESASELARDIERYLADEPVEARPPAPLYRVAKFAKRHRVGLAASIVIGISLVTTAVVSLMMAIKATRSEADSAAVLKFVREHVLAANRPEDWGEGLGRDVSLQAALDVAEKSITTDFVDRPAVEAAVRDTLGMNYWYLGDSARAVVQLERAARLREAHLGKAHPETLDTLNNLASALNDSGKFDEAVALAKEVLAARRQVLGTTHPDTVTTLHNLAADLLHAGHGDEAIPLAEEAFRLRKSRLGPDDPLTLLSMNNLALIYQGSGRIDEAMNLFKQAHDLERVRLGPDHLYTLLTLGNLASAYCRTGKASEALPLFERALAVEKTKLGPDHPRSLRTMSNLATANWMLEKRNAAIQIYEEALRLQTAKQGANHPDTLTMAYNLAMTYRVTGQAAKSVPLFEAALAAYRVNPGVKNEDTLTTMNNLAAAYLDVKNDIKAEQLLRECLAIRARSGPGQWERFHTMSQLGTALAGQKKFAEAEPMLTDGYKGLRDRESQLPPVLRNNITQAASRITSFYEASGKPEKATEWRAKLEASVAGVHSQH